MAIHVHVVPAILKPRKTADASQKSYSSLTDWEKDAKSSGYSIRIQGGVRSAWIHAETVGRFDEGKVSGWLRVTNTEDAEPSDAEIRAYVALRKEVDRLYAEIEKKQDQGVAVPFDLKARAEAARNKENKVSTAIKQAARSKGWLDAKDESYELPISEAMYNFPSAMAAIKALSPSGGRTTVGKFKFIRNGQKVTVTTDAKGARELAEEINALRVKAGLPAKSFPGTSAMALQVILNQAQRGDFGKTNDAISTKQLLITALSSKVRTLEAKILAKQNHLLGLGDRIDPNDPLIVELNGLKEEIKELSKTKDAAPTKNFLGEKEYHTYQGWRTACKTKNPKVRFEGDKDICSAPGVGEWDGEKGVVYSNY